MNKKIAIESVTLKLKTCTGTVEVVPAASAKGRFKAGGSSCYNTIGFAVSAATDGTVSEATGTGVIQGNSKKTKSNSLPIVLEDAESATVVLTGTTSTSPFIGTFTDTVVILDSGQNEAGAK